MSLTADALKKLKAPFEKDRLGVKVQSLSRDKTKAMLVCYLQHTDVMDRIEEVDPAWTTEVLAEGRCGDTVYVRLRMTACGVSRENVGEGGDPKAAYSDALKRCAMLFGVGRYLYDSETVWVPYNEVNDRYRAWTYDDYKKFLKNGQAGVPLARAEEGSFEAATRPTGGWGAAEKAAITPRVTPEKQVRKSGRPAPTEGESERQRYSRILMSLYRPYLAQYPEVRFAELLHQRYQVGETRLMTLEQLEDLVSFIEGRLAETVK